MRIARFLVLGFLLAGCGKQSLPDEPAHAMTTNARGDLAVTPYAQSRIDGLWPNDDGHSWGFAYRYDEDLTSTPQVYETEAEVPPAPSPEEVLPALRTSLTLDNPQTGTYGLVFRGQTTTLSGATGQNLVESLTEPGILLGSDAAPGTSQRLMNRLGWARPDLRGRIAALGVSTRKLDTFPILVHGGAWQKTLDYIGTFGDLDQNLAWEFLDGNVKQGASFRLQLVPSVVDDAFLTGWVVPNRLRTKDSRGGKSVEVVYVIDYGTSESVDQSGSPIGFYRVIGYGSVTYVPDVGPVSMIEREIAPVEHPEHPLAQITLSPGSFITGP